jgi:hypothetical protein
MKLPLLIYCFHASYQRKRPKGHTCELILNLQSRDVVPLITDLSVLVLTLHEDVLKEVVVMVLHLLVSNVGQVGPVSRLQADHKLKINHDYLSAGSDSRKVINLKWRKRKH